LKKTLLVLMCFSLLLVFSCTQPKEAVEEEAPAENVVMEESAETQSTFSNEEHPIDQPLKLGFDMGFIPYHYFSESGEALGFGIEVSKEVAKRLGRPDIDIVDVNWSGIFSGMFAGQYEAILFSINITQERSEMMDFTEPFMASPQMLIAREADVAQYAAPNDLKGKKLAVSSGSVVDTWGIEASKKYDFEVVRYDKIDDAVMALLLKKIDVVGLNVSTADNFIKEKEGLGRAFTISMPADYALGYQAMGFATRKDDPFRYELEKVLEGMKMDGTLQKIMEPYFGKVSPEDYANIVFTGYGCPGIRAYEPEAFHKPIMP